MPSIITSCQQSSGDDLNYDVFYYINEDYSGRVNVQLSYEEEGVYAQSIAELVAIEHLIMKSAVLGMVPKTFTRLTWQCSSRHIFDIHEYGTREVDHPDIDSQFIAYCSFLQTALVESEIVTGSMSEDRIAMAKAGRDCGNIFAERTNVVKVDTHVGELGITRNTGSRPKEL